MIRVAPFLSVLVSCLSPLSGVSQEGATQAQFSWLLESGIAWVARGGGYLDEQTYLSVETGPLWHYHSSAALGVVVRKGLSFEGPQAECRDGPCVVEERATPWTLEARFVRRAGERLDVVVGAGRVFDFRDGFAAHVGFNIADRYSMSLHADRHEGDWYWILNGGLEGRAGLFALGAGLALRWFTNFGSTR